MAVFYDSWEPKDRNDRCSRNVTIASFLTRVGGTFASAIAFLDTDTGLNTDTTLTFESGGVMSYDSATKKLSVMAEAGAPGVKYLVTIRITLTDGRHYDQSFWQEVRHN
jgi:hypothetical protein